MRLYISYEENVDGIYRKCNAADINFIKVSTRVLSVRLEARALIAIDIEIALRPLVSTSLMASRMIQYLQIQTNLHQSKAILRLRSYIRVCSLSRSTLIYLIRI